MFEGKQIIFPGDLMNANNNFEKRNQTILFFQPRFGNIYINGRNSRWLHNDKDLFGPLF